MARTQRTPQKKLGQGTAAREQELIAPQNMPAVERYGLGSANEKEAGRLVSSCGARRELRLAATGWLALHAAGRGARWQMSNEGLWLRPKGAGLCCAGREGPSCSWNEARFDVSDGGLPL